METLFEIFLLMHIVAGSIGLTSFWIPIFARKGRGLHSKAGKVFAYAMMATATSAAIVALLTIIDPLGTHPSTSSRYAVNLRAINGLMLLYLAVLTYGAAFTGLRAVRMKKRWGAHRDTLELGVQGAVFLLAAAVMVVGLQLGFELMIGLSIIGLVSAPKNIRLILFTANEGAAWKYQHMSAMLGAGIAAHTAFLVFGAGRFVDSALGGSVWVWLAPTLIGVPATAIWARYLRRQEKTANPEPETIPAAALEATS